MTATLLPQAQLGVKKTTISASVLRELKPEKKIGIEKGSREESYIQKLETIKEFFLKRYKNDVLTLKEQRKRLLAERRRKREEEIEENKKAKKESKSSLSPRLRTPSFFKDIFSSIGNFFLYLAGGLLFNSFIGLEKSLAAIVKTLEAVGQGIQIFANAIGSVTNFIDSAYKGYDKMVKQISDITGLSQEQINDFSSKFNKLINGTLIASMLILRGLPGFLRARNAGRLGRTGIKGFGSSARGFTKRQLIKRYVRRYGVNAGRTRFGSKAIAFLGGQSQRSALTNLSRKALVRTLGKSGTRNLLKVMKKFITPMVKNIPLIGALIDFALNVFVFKEPPGRAAFKAIGAGLGLWIGGALGTLIPLPGIGTAIGTFLGGTGGDVLGGVIYDSIFGDKLSQSTAGLDTQAAYEETTETTNNIIQPIVFA